MAKLPDKDTLAKEAAREALNFEINGKTFHEWLEILARYVTEQEEAPKEANLFFYDAKKEAITPLKYSKEAREPRGVIYSGNGYADGREVYDLANCPACNFAYEEGDKDWGEPFCPHCGHPLIWDIEKEK